jgi:hypothetical protein
VSTLHGVAKSISVDLPADALSSYGRNGYFRCVEIEIYQAPSGEIMLSGYSKRRGDREPARLTLDGRAARRLAASLSALVGADPALLMDDHRSGYHVEFEPGCDFCDIVRESVS